MLVERGVVDPRRQQGDARVVAALRGPARRACAAAGGRSARPPARGSGGRGVAGSTSPPSGSRSCRRRPTAPGGCPRARGSRRSCARRRCRRWLPTRRAAPGSRASRGRYCGQPSTRSSGRTPSASTRAVAVDVGQEPVHRPHALGEPGLELPPLAGRDDARHAVDRDDAFLGLVAAVDGEGDSLAHERMGHAGLNAGELRGRESAQRVMEGPAVLAGRPVRQEHLVVHGGVELVAAKVHVPWTELYRIGGGAATGIGARTGAAPRADRRLAASATPAGGPTRRLPGRVGGYALQERNRGTGARGQGPPTGTVRLRDRLPRSSAPGRTARRCAPPRGPLRPGRPRRCSSARRGRAA